MESQRTSDNEPKESHKSICRDSFSKSDQLTDRSAQLSSEHSVDDDDVEDEQSEEEEPCQEETREKPWDEFGWRKALNYKGGTEGPGIRKVMEYDLVDMYPEMSLLTEHKRREWNFQDPAVIRALWLESKTNALAEWKLKRGKLNEAVKKKPAIEVRSTITTEARLQHRRLQNEKRIQALQEQMGEPIVARNAPDFSVVEIASNATTDMRLKFNKNDPTVPRYYLEHFQRYKKPPFRTAIPLCKRA